MKIELKSIEPSLKSSWILNLRWIAVIALFATPRVVRALFGLEVNTRVIYLVAALIAFYNLLLSLAFGTSGSAVVKPAWLKPRVLDNAQIMLDLFCLTALIHFSGGVENPFIFYFIFHVIISGIILRGLDAFFQTTAAALMFLALALGEYSGMLHHHAVTGYPAAGLYANGVYVAGVSVVFISTLYISFYMAASISKGLKEREEKLIVANKMLEENDIIKNEYVLRVSHDIKGHIAAIQSSIQPVMGGYAGELNEKQKNLLERADNRTEKLMQFVKALLNLTILKLKKSEQFEAFDLVKTTGAAVSFVTPAAKQKNISIVFSPEKKQFNVTGVASEIQATIIELLTNAVRYSPAGGRVTADVKASGDYAVIEVRDSGMGIPGDEMPRIFDEFYRAQNAKEADSSSSGLGLAMAKHVIEKHKGKIEVESELGEGTIFRIFMQVEKK
jgi:signal transduction histidine kinase